jgi:hypothetical protein
MIKLIGVRRGILLGVVLGLNLLMGVLYFLVLVPMRVDAESQLDAASRQISQLSNNVQNVKRELAAYPANYAQYQDLGKKGFFTGQDRFQAGRILDDLREKSGLLGYSYKLDAIRPLANKLADAANSNLIDSRITIDKISSPLDIGVYALIANLYSSFPQHVRLQKFEIRRLGEVNEASLAGLSTRTTGLIDATLVFDWLTVVPKAAESATGAQSGEFRGR